MTDLERAHLFMQEHFDCQDVICTFAAGCGCAAEIAHLVAAARREGEERMRERAAQIADSQGWERTAAAIRALPLTPEELPTTDSTPDPPPEAKAHPE